MPRGLFVTGTDTGVGKTVVSAALLRRYGPRTTLQYWKPIQTGIEQDDDTAEVRRLTAGVRAHLLDQGVRLPRPVSPHLAAALAGTSIDLGDVLAPFAQASGRSAWIVEGAGGVLVPINRSVLMVDLMAAVALPVLIVSRSTLGTINHTLLTLDSLRARSIPVAGVVMVGELHPENREAIEQYGKIPVVGELPRLDPLTADGLARWVDAWHDGERLWEYLR